MEKDICYVDLLDIECIIPIIHTMGQIIYPEYGTIIGPFEKEEENKNIISYNVEFTSSNSYSWGNKIIIKCSNGKELSIDHQICNEYHYYDISYKLTNGDNITFVFRTPTISKTVPIIDHVSISKDDLIKTKYNGKDIKNNVLSEGEDKNTLELHKEIIKSLSSNQFDKEEILMLNKKIDDKMYEEHKKRQKLIVNDLIHYGR